MTYVVMDNWVYGLTKKQTSPTSPLGFKSKTDLWGAVDQPINPMKHTRPRRHLRRAHHATPINHMLRDDGAPRMDHDGFSFIECLSECVEFYEGAFDAANPRKGGAFDIIDEKKNDGTPEDDSRHDVTDEVAAFKLAPDPWPGTSASSTKTTPDQERARAEVDRHDTREARQRQRPGDSPAHLRSNEVTTRSPLSS